MDIAGIFQDVAEQMRADIEKARKALKHSGLKGSSFEETFRVFLREYLPRSLDISTGQIVDSMGGVSRQLDVIVSDTTKTPILFRSNDLRVVPIECVYAVFEVKAFLDGDESERTYSNMESVKNLKKTAFNKEDNLIHKYINMYGQKWDIWPVNYYIFAYDSIDLITITSLMREKNMRSNYSTHFQIDSVCVLDKGVVTNRLVDGNFNALPEPQSLVQCIKTRHALLLFYTLISRYFNQAWLPPFRFLDYIGNFTFGDGEI